MNECYDEISPSSVMEPCSRMMFQTQSCGQNRMWLRLKRIVLAEKTEPVRCGVEGWGDPLTQLSLHNTQAHLNQGQIFNAFASSALQSTFLHTYCTTKLHRENCSSPTRVGKLWLPRGYWTTTPMISPYRLGLMAATIQQHLEATNFPIADLQVSLWLD